MLFSLRSRSILPQRKMESKYLGMVILGVLALASCSLAADEKPMPGTQCKSSSDCNGEYSKLQCVKKTTSDAHVCSCENFRLPKQQDVIVPDFNTKIGRCFLRVGQPCGMTSDAIECEPNASCHRTEGEVGVGVCKEGGCDKGASPEACKGGAGNFPATSPFILGISMVLAMLLKGN